MTTINELLWVPATDFVAGTGAPSMSSSGSRTPCWLLDQTTPENVRGAMCIPLGWATARVNLVWANGSAAAGDVSWTVDAGTMLDGSALGDTWTQLAAVGTAPAAAGTPKITVLATAQAVSPGPNHIRVQRVAGAGADTLAGDSALLGLLLSRVT